MAIVHVSQAEAIRNFESLLSQVIAGAEVVVEQGSKPVAFIHAAEPQRRTIEECIALLPADSPVRIDEDFARDVDAVIAAHREPLAAPDWD